MNMIVDVVMQHLLSKDVLYQPMKVRQQLSCSTSRLFNILDAMAVASCPLLVLACMLDKACHTPKHLWSKPKLTKNSLKDLLTAALVLVAAWL